MSILFSFFIIWFWKWKSWEMQILIKDIKKFEKGKKKKKYKRWVILNSGADYIVGL